MIPCSQVCNYLDEHVASIFKVEVSSYKVTIYYTKEYHNIEELHFCVISGSCHGVNDLHSSGMLLSVD